MSDELRECPFCGSDKVSVIGMADKPLDCYRWHVECQECHCTGRHFHRDEGARREMAVAAWNRRVPQEGSVRNGNLNYCQVCGTWLGMDDYDGICTECDVETNVLDSDALTVAYLKGHYDGRNKADDIPAEVRSVLQAALIVYRTECREINDPNGEGMARQAQAWLDAQAKQE